MRRSKILLIALALALAGAGGGVAVATTSHSAPAAAPLSAGTATTHVTTATVAGHSEQILVDARGLPLYTYDLDTPTVSHVNGALAQLWPPLISNGQPVRYHGHFLYTFVNDGPGQVTGQGVQAFFVATPKLGASTSTPPPSRQPTGYGY
jgi:predicted lipoprotein with Yx(FWY)xxD motif